MSLFQRFLNGSRLTFNCVGLSDTELKDITQLVEENGGRIGECVLPIIFMPKSKYKKELHIPLYRVYDINFIKTCARRGKIVDFRPFRLGPKKLGESGILSTFIHGVSCYKCAMERLHGSPIIAESASSSEIEDEDALPVVRTISSPGNLNCKSPVDESQPVSNIFSRSVRRAASDSNVLASNSILQKPVKLSHSSDKQNKYHFTPKLLSSQETDSFQTADDEIDIKLEPICTQNWDDIPISPTSQMSVTSETERAEVSDPLSDLGIPSIPNTHLQSPDNSPNADREKSNSTAPLSTSSPRLRVLNVSQLMPRPINARTLQPTQSSLESQTHDMSEEEKATSLTSAQKMQKIPIAKNDHQTSTNSSEATRKNLRLVTSTIVPNKVNVVKKLMSPNRSRAAEHLGNNMNSIPTETLEASLCLSPTLAAGPEQESPWISTSDTWTHNRKKNNHVYPTTEYVSCNEGRAPLLRLNVASRNYVETIDDSTTCSDDNRDPPATSIKPRKKNTKLNNVRKEQKSPGTLKKTPETMKAASKKKPAQAKAPRSPIISDSEDEVEKTPTNGTNETLRKKTSRVIEKNHTPRRRENPPSDNEQPGPSGLNISKRKVRVANPSESDEDDVPQTICRTKSKARDNEGVRKEQRSPVTLKTGNKRNKEEKTAKPVSNVQTSCLISSDSDTEKEAPAKRRKNEELEVQRRKKKHKHPAFETDSEVENPPSVESATDVHSDSDSVITEVASNDDTNSDHNTTNRKLNHYAGREHRGKHSAYQYHRNWREKLEAGLKVKKEVTRMKFTRREQQTMVDFLCTYPDIERVQPKGLKVWYEMLNKGLLTYRTAQSLQNHFVKSLLPNIKNFFGGMTNKHIEQFKAIQAASGRKYL